MTRRCFCSLVLRLVIVVGGGFALFALPSADLAQPNKPAAKQEQRIVFLGGGLSDEQIIVLSATVAASRQPGVVLLHSPEAERPIKHFLTAFRPERIVPVGSFVGGVAELQRRLETKTAPGPDWPRGPPLSLWKDLLGRVDQVVVSPAEPRAVLLHSACLAGALRAPLVVYHGTEPERAEFQRCLGEWKAQTVYAVGKAAQDCQDLNHVKVIAVKEADVAATYLRTLNADYPVSTLVVANPNDTDQGLGSMSALAPWVALRHRAALLLTNARGDNTEAVVQAALQAQELARVDNLILVGNRQALPMHVRPNPLAGKDAIIEMEPMTPSGSEPFTLATGRLFHPDRAVVTLMLARPHLFSAMSGPRKALVVSNPGGGLPLLETFSRNSVHELRNRGYQTTALFHDDANKEAVRRLLPSQDLFLWEGHYKTMVERYSLPGWPEPMGPSLVILQSCLALNEKEALPLVQRGAVALVGSSTRTYSATGGAFTLAFLDALLYENQSVGGALRQAKNFLLLYSLLKEKRLGSAAKFNGANVRSAWAFTLWGDPTLRLPHPPPPANARTPFRHEVHGNTIVFYLPDATYEKVRTEQYQSQMAPNARLAGLLNKNAGEDVRHLVSFYFAEVSLPQVPADRTPRLRSPLPDQHWAFGWDARRRCGYLLVLPRAKDQHELRFQVDWDR